MVDTHEGGQGNLRVEVASDSKNVYVAHLSMRSVWNTMSIKGDPGITLRTCGAIGERAQVIIVQVNPKHWERLPFTKNLSNEIKAISYV